MNSYAIYRIAETLRVLFFMTLAILVFNFYPLTAVMIVMLALLNDGAILSIAYDNVRYKAQPEAWNMRMVLGISTVLGVIGVVAAFGLFYLGERVFHLDRPHIQTLMYLKLSIRPARILWMAVLGTQTVATLIAVYGVFMTPLGWKWAGFVWGYALIWFLINDRIKLLAYRIFDPIKPAVKPADKDAAKPDSKTAPKPETKAESKPENKVEPKSDGENKSEAEVTKDSKPKDKEEAKPAAKAESKPEAKPESKPAVKDESKPEAKVQPKPEAQSPSDVTPQLVKRVHELYEELGREEVKAVQEWDKANQQTQEDAPDEARK